MVDIDFLYLDCAHILGALLRTVQKHLLCVHTQAGIRKRSNGNKDRDTGIASERKIDRQ